VDDCCVNNFDCVQPDTCQDGCCVTPPPPPCPPPAPNRCPSTGECIARCDAGQVFDAGSCTCRCSEHHTCCSCIRGSDSAFLCFEDKTNREFCLAACDAAGADLDTVSFSGGGAANVVCDFTNEQCNPICEDDI
jgi:hypothetical protein